MAVLYPFDPTGMAADNLVFEEPHAVTESHYRDYHFIIPDVAPFYAEGLVITLAGSEPTQVLTAGVDYFEVLPYEAATRSIGKPIYGAIALNSRWTSGVLLLTYQTLGGQWVADRSYVYKALAEKAYNPRTTVWDVLTNVAEIFPPINHTQNFSDYYDEGQLIQAITRLGTDIAREADSLPIVRHLRNFDNPHKTTKAQVGLPLVENYPMATTEQALSGQIPEAYISPKTLGDVRTAIKTEFSTGINGAMRWISSLLDQLNRHKADLSNPHQVTKDQLGLDLVGNWRMAESAEVKVSTSDPDFMPATDIIVNPQTLELVRLSVLDNLATAVTNLNTTIQALTDDVDAHKADENNPHKVTKTQLELDKVGNWPMSTAAEALDGMATDSLINPSTLQTVRTAITDSYTNAITDTATTINTAIDTKTDAISTALTDHTTNENNPHKVTATQLGLSKLGNWGMATTEEAIAGKATDSLINPSTLRSVRDEITKDIGTAGDTIYTYINETVTTITTYINEGGTALDTHTVDYTNPHRVTATQVGLGNVADLPLATDLEVANGEPLDKYVTLRQITTYLTARAGLLYSVAIATEVVEGESIAATLTTARVVSGKQYYWSIVHGTTTTANFTENSGVVSVTDNTAVWSITATLQPELNPDRSFSLMVREDSINGRVVAISDPVTLINVTRLPDYQFNIAHTDVILSKSYTMPISLTVTNTPVGTTLYWEVAPLTAIAADFKQNAGEVIVSGSVVNWTIEAYATMANRYLSTFKIKLRRGSADGEIIAMSELLTFVGTLSAAQVVTATSLFAPGVSLTADNYYKVTTFPRVFGNKYDTRQVAPYKGRALRRQTGSMAAFSLVPSVTMLNEGDSLRVNVTTSRDVGYQTVYWKVIHDGTTVDDFVHDSGILEIIGTNGHIDLTTIFKTTDVGERSFSIGLMASSYTEAPFATTIPITLMNIDTATLYRISTTSWSIATKLTKSLNFTATTSKLANGTNLRWKIKHINTLSTDFTSDVGVAIVQNDTTSFSVSVSDLIKRLSVAQFRVQLYEGINLLVTSALVTVYYYEPTYAVSSSQSTYDSMTVTSIPVTVTTAHLSDTTLYWKVIPITSGLGNGNFTLVQGSVAINSGTGSINVGLKTTIQAIDPAQFIVRLFSDSSYMTQVAVTATITVTDLTVYPTYSLTAGASTLAEGQSWPLSLATTSVNNDTTLYWTILLETALATQFKAVNGTIRTTGDTTSWTIATNASLLKDMARTFRVQIHTGSASGTVVATSASLTISDIVGIVLDVHHAMPCCLYEATKPIDAADYYVIGVHSPLRR